MQQNSDYGPSEEARVSVVIPYSPEHTPSTMLERAKQSVERQSVRTEIIVIEDTEQRGPAWARNQGIAQSSSRFVAFLDADDEWCSDKLDRQITVMEEHNVGICVEGNLRNEDGQINCEEFTQQVLFGDLSSLTSSIVIDRTRVDAQFREDLARFEDHLFMIEAAIEGNVYLIPERLVKINKHDGGLSARGTPEQTCNARLSVSEYLSKHSQTEQFAGRLRQLAYYGLGRQRQLEGNSIASIAPLLRSLSYGLSVRTIGALLIIPWQLVRNALID